MSTKSSEIVLCSSNFTQPREFNDSRHDRGKGPRRSVRESPSQVAVLWDRRAHTNLWPKRWRFRRRTYRDLLCKPLSTAARGVANDEEREITPSENQETPIIKHCWQTDRQPATRKAGRQQNHQKVPKKRTHVSHHRYFGRRSTYSPTASGRVFSCEVNRRRGNPGPSLAGCPT